MMATGNALAAQVGVLLRGETNSLRAWIGQSASRCSASCTGIILVGSGLYGAAMGVWRAPLQAGFVAIKLPLIILLTALGNALLNSILAPLLGLNIGLRQSFLAILMSFAIASAILGSFSPLVAFLIWNAPPLNDASSLTETTYNSILLVHVGVIALAGIAANLHLLQLLRTFSTRVVVARRVLVGWLTGNLFLGSQLAWILRPFIGSPDLQIEFLRKSAFHGNFYETVFRSIVRLMN